MSSDAVLSLSAGLDHTRLQRITHWLDRQVSTNRMAGGSVLVARRGVQAYFHATGTAGVNTDPHNQAQTRAFQRDTIVRLYSMTKPVTTMAAMMLYEQGCFGLDDPIDRYLPAFSHTRVWDGKGALKTDEDLRQHTRPMQSPITVRQLMNHTAGFTYSFMNANAVDAYYNDHSLVFPGSPESLGVLVDRLASAPLLCQPGTQWNYSVATDVLGRLVEIWSGNSLAQFFDENIFSPLKMDSTGFHVRPEQTQRFADLYGPAAGGDLGTVSSAATNIIARGDVLEPPLALDVLESSLFLQEPSLYSGGGGLVGSIDDYARFCQCLLNDGELNGQRLLGRKTIRYMRQNHLPDNSDMAAMGQAQWSETSYKGVGFGLGFAVVLDPLAAGMLTSAGEHHWGGAASTFFWIDPAEQMYVVFLTQLYPSSSYPFRTELRTMVSQALI